MNRGLVAEIDLAALDHNLSILRGISGDRTFIAVVKADAYGHGAVEVSRRLVGSGVTHLAVAYVGEAKALREAGIGMPILVLFDRSGVADCFTHRLTPVVQDVLAAERISREARSRNEGMAVHLKVDTGMGRLGTLPEQAVASAIEISRMEGITLAGVLSHFSEADLSDRTYAVHQIAVFRRICGEITSRTGLRPLVHMANSAALLTLDDSLLGGVRPGLALYGCSPFREDFGLRPVMSVSSRILVVREMPSGSPISYGRTFVTRRDSRIAVIPVGYADGFSRLLSNNADVLVCGRRAPVAGRVCMDLTMVDVTDIPEASEGGEVVLLGAQGDESISAGELSSRIGTIPYEIMTSLGSRARRVFSS